MKIEEFKKYIAPRMYEGLATDLRYDGVVYDIELGERVK